MGRSYWLDLFTGRTWEEFLKRGGNVSGFRKTRGKTAGRVKPGDYFICYVTGISRFIAILEVKSKCYSDTTPIYEEEVFPVRFKVEVVHKLMPETALPVHDFRDKLSIFQDLKNPKAWTGFFRGSPRKFEDKDGEYVVNAIIQAEKKPVKRSYDKKKYNAKLRTIDSNIGVVTVPENEVEKISKARQTGVTHEEIQYLLLKLGSDMGLDIWVARNDKNKEYNGVSFSEIARLRKELPLQFDTATTRIIEMIDVIWLKRDALIAAFEVEHTTSIYSGLLRMSDLVSLQPNIRIKLYLVAADEKREKVFTEINRPTFARLSSPLNKMCKFISYSELKKELKKIGEMVRHMKPDFIDDIAESCEFGEL